MIRSQRHDYNFHVQTLHGLLLRKDYDACEKYLEELLADSVRMNRILPLADAAVSALLLSFQSRAAAQGIGLQIDIENDLSQIATNVYETNKIIGNLLQNAIDETERLKDKSYRIRFLSSRGILRVPCLNRTEKRESHGALPRGAFGQGKGTRGSASRPSGRWLKIRRCRLFADGG